jgi:YVTN family beta-propeller protein
MLCCCGLILMLGALAAPSRAQSKKPTPPKTPQFGHWGPSGYHLIRTIPIPGNDSFGRLEFNAIRRRVFLADGAHVVIINPYLGKIVGNIPNMRGARDVAFAPELRRGFISEEQANDVAIFDSLTLKVLAKAPTAPGPDAIIYDPATKRVFTMNPRSNTATAINAVTGKRIGDIPLGGQPSVAVTDGQGHIYINLRNTSEEVQLDAKTLAILNRWTMSPCENPAGLSIDPKERILFIGCRDDKMGIMNADTGKILAAPATGAGAGTGRFDPVTKYALSANADGTLTIVIEAGEDRFNVVENVETERGARNMALDPKIHEVFLVTADFEPLPPNAPPDMAPTMIPGTTHVLVFARDYLYK